MPKYTNVPNSIIDPTFPFMSGGSKDGQLEPDYEDAYAAWKTSDTPKTRGAMLRAVRPVLDTAVYSYAGKNASPAVRSKAKMLALQAFKTYDPTQGNMKTHLLSNLRRLQREAQQGQQIIHTPERVNLDRQHLREAEEALRDRLGRDPSDAEVADYTGLSRKRIGYVRGIHTPINSGSILDDSGEVYSPASLIPGDTQRADAWREMVYYDLDGISQAVMDYTLGLHGAPVLSTAEIARRVGLTPGAISQRRNKIQGMLDEQYNVFGGDDA